MQSPKPTAEHLWLAGSCGVWRARTSMWMGPGEPFVLNGRYTIWMLPGGLWQVGDYAVDTGDFVGHGLMGYDTGQKKFVGSWVDTASTTVHHLEGQLDPGGRVLRVTASFIEPDSGKLASMEEVTERIDANHQRFTIMRSVNGKPMKVLEMDYTREP